MQRLRNERGAVGVVVALLMVPLIGFAAIAIDVSAMWSEHQQLQTGADAGALAIAQDCVHGACGTPSQTAQTLAASNLNSGSSTATITTLTTTKVTVHNSGIHQHWFAPVLGVNQSTVTADATAEWGWPIGGTAVLPLAFSLCEFNAQIGGLASTTEHTILFSKTSGTTCTGPSGNALPGGFGWLTPTAGTCLTVSIINGTVGSSTGNSVPSGCSVAYFQSLQGQTILLPIFDQAGGTGNNGTYHIYGYAAFKITGYFFGGQYKWNAPCTGNDRCVRGYFTRMADLSENFDIGAGSPQLGAAIITLTK
jgi:Flp pilus assembly protein TadG